MSIKDLRHVQCDRCGHQDECSPTVASPLDWVVLQRITPKSYEGRAHSDKVFLPKVDLCPACASALGEWLEQGKPKSEREATVEQ